MCCCKVLHRLSENFNATAEPHFIFQVIGHHQWLTLLACVLMWGPSLTERLLVIWKIIKPPSLVVSVFLFLLGHTHNLLRSVLHAVFAQQIHSITWQGNQLDMNGWANVFYILDTDYSFWQISKILWLFFAGTCVLNKLILVPLFHKKTHRIF